MLAALNIFKIKFKNEELYVVSKSEYRQQGEGKYVYAQAHNDGGFLKFP